MKFDEHCIHSTVWHTKSKKGFKMFQRFRMVSPCHHVSPCFSQFWLSPWWLDDLWVMVTGIVICCPNGPLRCAETSRRCVWCISPGTRAWNLGPDVWRRILAGRIEAKMKSNESEFCFRCKTFAFNILRNIYTQYIYIHTHIYNIHTVFVCYKI